MTIRALLLALLALAGSTRPAAAHAQGAAPMAFDVVTVKPNRSGPAAGQFIRSLPGGVVQMGNVPLRDVITWAYQLQPFQIVGGPEWLLEDRFDITARADRDLPRTGFDQVAPALLMMRALLAERFGLAVHRETRELAIYALVAARPDGRLGAGLRRSETDCAARLKAAEASGAPAAPLPPAPDGRPRCGLTGITGGIMAGGYPMSQLAAFLARRVERTVVDRTGLTGDWDIDLTFSPPQSAASDPNTVSLFTAVQEQLGLKLDAARGPVEVLVIDGASRPRPD